MNIENNIVDKLIQEGWFLKAVDATHRTNSNHYYLVPPDNRQGWSANWKNVPYGSLVILVPGYAMNNPRGKPPPGMPPRFGRRRMW